ncbi:hypothetical protein [Mucilaginibacter gotjawali]|uniref:Negative regulator of sigma E activity n=1 Tax=Mucilaginibacter gotjawali TaxID=1550579 RepID=A0A839SGQ2_9SPHI|nr:hypothetical protein [Mucilaginibacter gotjawali]MBB3056698.1 negative regulator of sigma E activity [Mucilaginibacter gotjawali]
MSTNSQHTETIIQYLDGELSGAELKQFEELLAADNAVQQELENLKLAQQAVRSYGIKAQVASLHHEMMEELKTEPKASANKLYPFIRASLKIAASLFLAMSAVGIYQYATVSPAQLYNQNYRPYTTSISRGATEGSALEKAYAAGQPAKVISLFEKETTTADNKTNFLAAQSYLATQNVGKAISLFNKILNNADGAYKDDAEYYLALSYIENKQPGQALVIMNKIHQDKDHPYNDRVSFWTIFKLKLLILKNGGK